MSTFSSFLALVTSTERYSSYSAKMRLLRPLSSWLPRGIFSALCGARCLHFFSFQSLHFHCISCICVYVLKFSISLFFYGTAHMFVPSDAVVMFAVLSMLKLERQTQMSKRKAKMHNFWSYWFSNFAFVSQRRFLFNFCFHWCASQAQCIPLMSLKLFVKFIHSTQAFK